MTANKDLSIPGLRRDCEYAQGKGWPSITLTIGDCLALLDRIAELERMKLGDAETIELGTQQLAEANDRIAELEGRSVNLRESAEVRGRAMERAERLAESEGKRAKTWKRLASNLRLDLGDCGNALRYELARVEAWKRAWAAESLLSAALEEFPCDAEGCPDKPETMHAQGKALLAAVAGARDALAAARALDPAEPEETA